MDLELVWRPRLEELCCLIEEKRVERFFLLKNLVLQKLSKPIFSSKSIRVFVVKSSEPGLRVSTPKKLFKLAVNRNKIKRQIKNIFQKNNLYQNDVIFVVMVFTPFLSLSYKEASFEICKAVKS